MRKTKRRKTNKRRKTYKGGAAAAETHDNNSPVKVEGCVGTSCTHNHGVQGVYLRNAKGVYIRLIVNIKFVDDILEKLYIDPNKVSFEQKQKYVDLLKNLSDKDIYDINTIIKKWENPDTTYNKLLILFTKLNIPYVTDNRGMIMNNYGRL